MAALEDQEQKVSNLPESNSSPVTSSLPPSPMVSPVGQAQFDQPVKSPPPLKKRRKGGRWRILVGLLVVAVVGIGGWLVYSSRQTGTPIGKKKLVYWGLWEDEEIMRPVLDEWEKKNPNVIVEYRRQSKEKYRERLQSALAQGEGPDIFRFHNTWVPLLKQELAPMPASIMTVSQFGEVFYPVAVKDLVWETNIYGIPLEIDTLALFINDEIFRQAGKSPPTNWDEMRETAEALTVRDAKGNVTIAGAAFGGTGNIEHWSDILGLMLVQNGARFPRFNSTLAEEVLDYYSYFGRQSKIWNPLFPSSTRAFAGGEVAMYFGFSWDAFEIMNFNNELKFTIVPVPQVPQRPKVNWASYWVEGVSIQGEYQDEAWKLLTYLSSPEVARQLYENQVKIGGRVFGEPYARKSMASELAGDPLVSPFLAQAGTAVSWYMCSRTFDNAINDSIIAYFEDAVNGVNDGDKIPNVLTTLATGLGTKLNQYQIPSDKQRVEPVQGG